LKRIISALLILPPLALLVHFGSPLHFLLLVILMVGLALVEFYRMLAAKGFPCWGRLGVTCGGMLPFVFYISDIGNQGAVAAVQGAVASIIVLLFLVGLFTCQELVTSVQSMAFTLLGVFYIGWLLSYLVLLRLLIDGPHYVFYVFGVVWLGDAVALVCGTLFGRHKFAPTLSPRKTIEGAVGGLLGSLCGATLGGRWLLGHFTLTQCLVVGCLLAVLGQLGDLSESLLKRSAGVKDSGVLIPGHGGILDKVDGILFGAPALYYYILYVIGPELPS
jgi:phosphatidate cytidylyltransferase